MDEDSETRPDIPEFIRNAIKQLISLKSNISTIDNFHNDINKENVNVDMIDFANKVKDFLNSLNTTVTDVNSAFLISFEAFINESKINDTNTRRNNCDNENVNTDLDGSMQQKNKTHENVDGDASLTEETSKMQEKSSKKNNSEISDSDTSLKTPKLHKKRRKTISSRISENDNTDSDCTERNNDTKTNVPNTKPDENDTEVHKSKINEKIVHEEGKTSDFISDSDKENTKNERKELTKETNKKVISKLNNNSDSEKELSSKTNKKKSKKVAESDNKTDSSTKKLKENEKKKKFEKITNTLDSDSDLDSDGRQSKSAVNKKNEKSKIVSDSDTENSKKGDNVSESDSKTHKKKLKASMKSKTKSSKSESESDKNVKNRSKKEVARDLDTENPKKANNVPASDLNSHKSKSKSSKKSKKKCSKSESESDENLDLESIKSKSMNETITKSEKPKVASGSDSENPKKDDNNISDLDSHKKMSKASRKSKKETKKFESESDKKEIEDEVDDVNKTNSLDSDSDSYLEDPRIIIEKSKKALAEQRKSDSKSTSKTKDPETTKTGLDSDSDSYLENPRLIIERSKRALIEQRKSGSNSKNSKLSISEDCENTKTNDDLFDELKTNDNLFDEFKSSESNNTNKVDCDKTINENLKKDKSSLKTLGSPKVVLNKIDSEIGGKKNISKNKNDTIDTESSDDIESAANIENESDNTKINEEVNNDVDIVTDDNKNQEYIKPKLGFLKCIDINKLLDPQVVQKSDKLPSSKKNDSVIVLSSTDSECEPILTRKRTRTRQNKQKSGEKSQKSKESSKKSENITDKSKKEDSEDEKAKEKCDKKKNKSKKKPVEDDSDDSSAGRNRTHRSRFDTKNKKVSDSSSVSSSVDRTRRSRFDRKKEMLSATKQNFEQLRLARQIRNSFKKSLTASISSDNDSDSSNSPTVTQKDSVHEKKQRGEYKIRESLSFNIDPDYDYSKDIKFKVECYVSLPKIPVEKLKEHYLQEREDAEIKRLTNMNSLKRTRQQKNAASSSDSDVKTAKKRTKVQQRKKKIDDEEHLEQSDKDSHMSDEPIINIEDNINKKDLNLPIPDDILKSDKDFSNSSDNEDEDKKSKKGDEDKKSKKGSKKKEVDKKTGEEKTTDDTEENGKDSGKQTEDNEKSKWRNDPLLRGKLDASDSEEELIRFRNKKNKVAEDIKSKTKKQLKRIARRLGSDVSSSEDEKKKKSDSEKESSAQYLTSDSEEEKNTKKKPVRRRIKRIKDSDESTDGEERDKKDKKTKKDEEDTRKKIRNVWSKDSLADATKEAVKEEEERKKRIADKQKLYNEIYDNKFDLNAKVDKVILDFNEETKEDLLSVHPDLVRKLKPHQAKGVQFMWTACFESLERAKNTEGSGCILAHCMGLGKTLQVITLIHTLLSNTDETNVKTVLVVCPLSTVLNWVNEFKKWLDDLDGEQVNVFDLVQHKQNFERLYQMQDWMKFGGVLVIGYDMFRNLSTAKGKRMSKKMANGFNQVLLEPGPDLVVCDEGHLLKNEKTGISIAMNRLRTKRRIVLTGTPLQNNLKEYFCMVQFVKPSLLGTYKEYLNRFVNPITNGQYTDSTPHDIQIMRRRAHVLHKMLDAVVERRDYNVLAPFLPPKHEFVLFITLTSCQIELYKEYLTKFSRNTEAKGTSYLFQDFQELQRICIHPRVLLDKSNQDRLRRDLQEEDDSEGSLKDFIDDGDSDKSTTADESSSSESGSGSDKKASVSTRRTRSNPKGQAEEEPEPEPERKSDEWWSKHCRGDELDNINSSSKIKLLFDILHQCEIIGDKVLVFSQSLYSLNLIEYFLARIDEATQSGDSESLAQVGDVTGSWALGLDYFRLDGSTSCENRATWCKTFNNESNTRARLFLISTRAGGLGINLVAANRVIVFDVSWNPSYDIQSIYRVYRFGQTKPCYIYRFVTLGTMENKIYERQVTKQAISKRVIDEQQIDRHYNQTDLAELYAFNPIPDEERPIPLVPKDRLFADLLQSHEKYIFKYHEHNSLLEDKADEGLNEEERRAAWEEFENEKKAPKFSLMQTMVRSGMFETLRILVQEDNSGWTPAQINNILPMIVQRISEQVSRGDYSMYRRVEERHELRVLEQRRMQMVYQQYMQQLRNTTGNAQMTPGDINKLAQMLSAYNQNLMQPRPQMPSSSATLATFRQVDPPPQMVPGPVAAAVPIPHPAVNEVVELND